MKYFLLPTVLFAVLMRYMGYTLCYIGQTCHKVADHIQELLKLYKL